MSFCDGLFLSTTTTTVVIIVIKRMIPGVLLLRPLLLPLLEKYRAPSYSLPLLLPLRSSLPPPSLPRSVSFFLTRCLPASLFFNTALSSLYKVLSVALALPSMWKHLEAFCRKGTGSDGAAVRYVSPPLSTKACHLHRVTVPASIGRVVCPQMTEEHLVCARLGWSAPRSHLLSQKAQQHFDSQQRGWIHFGWEH